MRGESDEGRTEPVRTSRHRGAAAAKSRPGTPPRRPTVAKLSWRLADEIELGMGRALHGELSSSY
jgi:hypothetical protein